MTAELALTTTPADASLAEKVDYAKALAPADLLPPAFRGKPANVLLAMEAGRSLGKTAVEIMQNSHVISGKLGFSAEYQRALVLEAGHRIRVFMDGDTAVAMGARSDDPEYQPEIRWTWQMAVDAKLTSGPNKDNWAKWPRNMLKARATTDLCRDLFPDVIRGYRSAEELRDTSTTVTVTPPRPGDTLRAAAGLPVEPPVEPVEDIHDAEIVDVTTNPDAITPNQIKLLHTLFGEKQFAERDDKIEFVRMTLDNDAIQSSKELTFDEASQVITALRNLAV